MRSRLLPASLSLAVLLSVAGHAGAQAGPDPVATVDAGPPPTVTRLEQVTPDPPSLPPEARGILATPPAPPAALTSSGELFWMLKDSGSVLCTHTANHLLCRGFRQDGQQEAGVLDAWWPDPACRPTRGIAGDGYDGQAQVGSLTLGDPAVGNVCYLTAEAGIEHPTFMYSDPALTAMARAGTARLPGWVTSAPLTLGVAVFEFH